jgi:hypothetical protein
MEPAVYDDLPAWGQLPAEQYLIVRPWPQPPRFRNARSLTISLEAVEPRIA